MNLQALENSLVMWWRDLLPKGASGAYIVAADGRAPFPPPNPGGRAAAAHAFYSFTSIVREHHEEISTATDPGTGLEVPAISGMRHVVCTIRVDSFDQRPNMTAQHLAERARTRLLLPRIVDVFTENGYSIQETRPTVQLPFPADDRLYSRAAFEVLFGYLSTETETVDTGYTTTIDTVEIASDTIKGPDGEDLEPQITLTVTRP